MSDEEAMGIALSMTSFQRKVILECARGKSWGYGRIAEKLGAKYDEVRSVGHYIQRTKLGHVSPVRHGSEFAGSAIFLNPRGDHVRMAIEIIERRLLDAQN
jgi:hypothetical protein